MNKNLWPSKEKLEKALYDARYRVDKNMEKLGFCFPSEVIRNSRYGIIENNTWATGFWPGTLWLAYELTGDERYKKRVEKLLTSFKVRIENEAYLGHHDLGFLYSLSCVAGYKITGNEDARHSGILAADYLARRFEEKGQFINAWWDMESRDPAGYFYIIDCMLNVPLLYWAYHETGNEKYKDVADRHVNTTIDTIIRPDGSTYHKYHFDIETGAPIYGKTAQGFSDESAWSRGQSWGVYGFALNYAETKKEKVLDAFKRVTDYFIDHLPEDLVPYWDFVFTEGDEPRDSSAALIFICGILEMMKVLPDDSDVKRYEEVAAKMLHSIIDNYASKPGDETDGMVLHVTGSKPHNEAVDGIGSYADYYYMEILARLLTDWKRYW